MTRPSHVANAAVLQALMDEGQACASALMAASGYPRAGVVDALHTLRMQGLASYVLVRFSDGSQCRLHSLTAAGIEAALAAAPAQITTQL
ncbi:MAG: hypothetical protein ACKVOO_12505 [Burkholderiaceae bacterium]